MCLFPGGPVDARLDPASSPLPALDAAHAATSCGPLVRYLGTAFRAHVRVYLRAMPCRSSCIPGYRGSTPRWRQVDVAHLVIATHSLRRAAEAPGGTGDYANSYR
jgi:hypothetical protein